MLNALEKSKKIAKTCCLLWRALWTLSCSLAMWSVVLRCLRKPLWNWLSRLCDSRNHSRRFTTMRSNSLHRTAVRAIGL